MDQVERMRQIRGEMVADFFQNPKGLEALGGKSIKESFKDEESVRATIEEMSEEDFEQLICGLNGTLLGKNRESWKIEDQKDIELASPIAGRVFTPRPQDKSELLSKSFNSAQEMSNAGRDMEDVALLLAASTNAIHPWEDGNGRTSRILYSLVTESDILKDKSQLLALASEDGRDELPLNPEKIGIDLDQIIQEEAGSYFNNLFADGPTKNFVFTNGVTDKQKKDVSRLYRFDEKHFAVAVSEFLAEIGGQEKYLKEFPNNRTVLMFDQLVQDLSPEDIDSLLEKYGSVKKKKVELLIDCIQNPDKEVYAYEKDGKTIRLLDKLKGALNT